MTTIASPHERLLLHTLAERFPTIDHAVGRLAALRATASLPRGAVHVFSDVHGDFLKLRHVINNGSGRLRPAVESLFGDSLSASQQAQLLNIIYYPSETWERLEETLEAPDDFLKDTIAHQVELLRTIARDLPLQEVLEGLPEAYREVVVELLMAPVFGRTARYVGQLLDTVLGFGKGPELMRRLSRTIRNLVFEEIVVAGDLGDRGPRIDRVIAYLMRQPNVSITWGNHDVLWMGACLGQPAMIATIIRLSLRYGRVAQLVEGYGIPLTPLVRLAQSVYGDDPCTYFAARVGDLEDAALIARMQKAIAIIQFKLEGQLIERHPEWGIDSRNLLKCIDFSSGEVAIDGHVWPLLDTHLPTVDPADPNALSAGEAECMVVIERAVAESQLLWEHMSYLFSHGKMFLVRDGHLIFHAAVPVDAEGTPLAFEVDGAPVAGRALFEALDAAVLRAWRGGQAEDADLLYYLWAGPISPLFGKDRMATFEGYFVEAPQARKETRNPYFQLIHTEEFCWSVLESFGVDAEHGLIVNGHVPVRVEKGETPVKSSRAVVIDGAFAAAYGDRGYTLLLAAERTCIAEHHPFSSVEDAIASGMDIIPQFEDLRHFVPARRRGDPEVEGTLSEEIAAMERLIEAYRTNRIGSTR